MASKDSQLGFAAADSNPSLPPPGQRPQASQSNPTLPNINGGGGSNNGNDKENEDDNGNNGDEDSNNGDEDSDNDDEDDNNDNDCDEGSKVEYNNGDNEYYHCTVEYLTKDDIGKWLPMLLYSVWWPDSPRQ